VKLELSSIIVLAEYNDVTVGGKGPKLEDELDDLEAVLALAKVEVAQGFAAMLICCCCDC